eukprot:CAMPEP_0194279662 /NCGR_PEP_ID=MMETSP0169-20130528/14054_1 /TAXON_ID=218684 /ORGANISM="Corethron pennatum, Strain L29A3" /LENGTH=331 /DNA_ID=CAMNT_0039024109 /DNA_START=39 /DNA_END=1034 /DNA_ORIENTATION=+
MRIRLGVSTLAITAETLCQCGTAFSFSPNNNIFGRRAYHLTHDTSLPSSIESTPATGLAYDGIDDDDDVPLTMEEEEIIAAKIDEIADFLSPETVNAYSIADLVEMGDTLLNEGTIEDDRLPFMPGVEEVDRLSHFEDKDLEGVDLYRDPRLRLVEDDWVPGYFYDPAEPRYDPPEEPLGFPEKPFTNNRFTKEGEFTDFTEMDPTRALMVARELARKNNNEWLPDGVSQSYREEKFREQTEHILGTFRKGDIDEEIVAQIRPALNVLNNVVELLSIVPTDAGYVFRFRYHGLLRHKHGMESWAHQMIEDCGVGCSRVFFEVGNRVRDYLE